MLIRDVWLTRPMIDQICALTKLHRRTVERWIEHGRIPETAYRLLDILQNGRIEQIHADWTGWTIDAGHGHLVTPVGECIGLDKSSLSHTAITNSPQFEGNYVAQSN